MAGKHRTGGRHRKEWECSWCGEEFNEEQKLIKHRKWQCKKRPGFIIEKGN
jgi:hypothetical protein